MLLSVVLGLESGAGSLPSEVISHSLTALAQHATTAEAFESVVDEVIDAARAQAVKDADFAKLIIVMKAIETLVGVKKGARIAGSSPTLALVPVEYCLMFRTCSDTPTKAVRPPVTHL